MINDSGILNATSLAFCVLGAVTLVQLFRGWRSFVDTSFTRADAQLASQLAIFVVPPLYILAHEFGHYSVAHAVGAEEVQLHDRVFWGFCTFNYRPDIVSRWNVLEILAAGPLVQLALGCLTLAAGVAIRSRGVWRYLLSVVGLYQIVFALVLYPLIDFATGWHNDFGQIYVTNLTHEEALFVAIGHAAVVVILLSVIKHPAVATALRRPNIA